MIHAAHAGKCAGCGEVIDIDDLIGLVDGEWVCEPCVEDAGGEDAGAPGT